MNIADIAAIVNAARRRRRRWRRRFHNMYWNDHGRNRR